MSILVALTRAEAAHLLRRTGFGVRAADLTELTGMTTEAAIDRVLDTSRNPAPVLPASLSDANASEWDRWVDTVQWWLDRMATVPAPVEEKLTLFWHGHFTSSQAKLFDMGLLARQNQLYRRLALGSFRDLVQGMAIEPAMLAYLDNASNRAGLVQENFGRELLELFTLGVGEYTESDVIAMSRAWTGHTTTSDGKTYQFKPTWHDGGSKTLFGLARNWDGPAAVDEILTGSKAVPASRFIARKLWSFLAYPDPDPAIVDALAATFRGSSLSIQALVRAILLRPEFWSPQARDGLVRSPIELAVAGMQATGLRADEANAQWWFERMGQVPFDPPNVSGWGQNAAWISTAAMWARADWAGYLRWQAKDLRALFTGIERLDAATAIQRGFDTFGITEPSAATRATLETWFRGEKAARRDWDIESELVRLLILTPDFQLA